MEQISRDGHRKRIRTAYSKDGLDRFEDHNALELFISLMIPRKDVKQTAYNLINTFGSFNGVLEADISELMKVDGIGETTATAINMILPLFQRYEQNNQKQIESLSSTSDAKEYVTQLLQHSKTEKIVIITLDNNLGIIKTNILADGNSTCADVETKKIIECVVKDGASAVLLAHNHPNGESTPSDADVNFTLKVLDLLRKLNIRLIDHIILGKNNICSMNNTPKYMIYFD